MDNMINIGHLTQRIIYPENGDRIVTIDCVTTSLQPVYMSAFETGRSVVSAERARRRTARRDLSFGRDRVVCFDQWPCLK